MTSAMESRLSDNLIPEEVVRSEDGRDMSPPRKQHKTKQKRKVSTVSLQDSGKTNKRTSQRQPSGAQTTQEMFEARELTTTDNFESVDSDHPSTLVGLLAEREDNSHNGALDLKQMTLDEEDTTLNEQRNEVTTSRKDEQTDDGTNLANQAPAKENPTLSTETEQRNVKLEVKLAQDDGLDISGTMDLSSLNVTDKDLPMIIQRAFQRKKKKCTQLILRDNALTSNGVKILVDELLTAPTGLKNLILSNNPGIGDAGIEHLARLLQTNRSITMLALHHTSITDRGVRILADALCIADAGPPPPLEKLYISFNNSITDQSLEPLIQILEQNQTLKALSLQHCSLSDRARRRLRQVGTKKKNRKFSLAE